MSLEIFWNEAIKQLKNEMEEQEFSMWFQNMLYESSENENLTVSVPSNFYRDQVVQRYKKKIEEKLFELSGSTIKMLFSVKNTPRSPETEQKIDSIEEKSNPGQEDTPAPPRRVTVKKPHAQLKQDYTFDTYVIGNNNSFAANAAKAIAQTPGSSYNPCLIYGGVGLGKTHLMQAIGNHVYYGQKQAQIVYIPAESFVNEFIQSIRKQTQHDFKNKYRNVDVLLIDDIHDLQNKKETQEELFHTFNALYDANKQMVFTCDRPVSELKDFTERLKSRFERGLTLDLQPPNYETRFAILNQKTETIDLKIDTAVIELIAKNITSNIRDLEAALTKLIAYARFVGKDIDMEITQQQLKNMFSNPVRTKISIDQVQKAVAAYFNISTSDLKGKKRTKAVTFPRQIAMYIIREITDYSTTEVGLEFGGRDHTTVMHSCQRIEDKMKSDPTLEPTIEQLKKTVREMGTHQG